jgi:hypothetical protein
MIQDQTIKRALRILDGRIRNSESGGFCEQERGAYALFSTALVIGNCLLFKQITTPH